MGTVTGEYAINFAGVGDTNPYSNANFDALTGTARIASGLWRSIDPGTLTQWHLDPGAYSFGGTIRAKMEVANASGFDGLWAVIIDASGNGYGVRCTADALTRVRWDAFSAAEVLAESVTTADSDEIEIQYVKGSGALTIYRNGTQVTALNLTDTTHAAATLTAGLFQRPVDAGQGGIRSFAADGLSGTAAALSSPTPSGTIGTPTTATIGATTDQATGTFYAVVDVSANMAGITATQIKSGQHAGGTAAIAANDGAVSSSSPSVGVSGLVANTAYAYAAVQNNANGDSNIVTGTFTTAAASATSGTIPGRLSGYRIATLMMN